MRKKYDIIKNMRKTVKNLNKLYAPAFEKMEKMSKFLGKNCDDHALDFHYGHRIKIGKQFTNELYPIPLTPTYIL